MIDWKRVEELRIEIGTDGFAEVADMFLEEAEVAVQALTTAIRINEVETQLHSLKGSALNLGLVDLAGICHMAERLATLGKPVDTAGIAAIYRASRTLLLTGIATGSAA